MSVEFIVIFKFGHFLALVAEEFVVLEVDVAVEIGDLLVADDGGDEFLHGLALHAYFLVLVDQVADEGAFIGNELCFGAL